MSNTLKVAREQPAKGDGMRCSPVFIINNDWAWCNAGFGTHGHLAVDVIYTFFCSACGQEVGNEKVIE